MSGDWATAGGAGGFPEGAQELLHKTEDNIDEVFQDEEWSQNIAKSLVVMDGWVSERDEIFQRLVEEPVGMEAMAQSYTAMRELYIRAVTRRAMFSTEVASEAIAGNDPSMDFLVQTEDYELEEGDLRERFEDAIDEFDTLPDKLVESELAMEEYITTLEMPADVVSTRDHMMVDRIWTERMPREAWFETDYRFGRGLRTIYPGALTDDVVDDVETYGDALEDEDMMDEITDEFDIIDDLLDSYDLLFEPFLDADLAIDYTIQKLNLLDYFYHDQTVVPVMTTRTDVTLADGFNQLWDDDDASEHWWNYGNPEPAATVEGTNIEANLSLTQDARLEGYALEVDWSSENNDDDFVGYETIELDFSKFDTVETHSNVDSSDLVDIVIRVEGQREVTLRDDDHPVDWNEYTIDVSDLETETTVEVGVAMSEAGTESDGIVRFGDITFTGGE